MRSSASRSGSTKRCPHDARSPSKDVLTFRLGFGCIMAVPGTYPIHTAVEALDLKTLGEPWMYNTGSQVLGVLLERAAGQPLSAFLRERMFEPLGMKERSGR